ncbi:BhlA/UviB family holin-like peptide [Clostridium felsineum]|uniref:BhlA/UviB family holin-like peptide n=1 Tax=Clostridium felsineum TaxID=36839 RepID=UPI00098C8A5F|nr:BhlA/UviB family holin-like peptide [Clostridium felsineum]URZ04142.1 hypothetical protein CLAUR_042300 [Clostridium felsineum]URZ17342.1 hypothetical protein CLFE_033950 [Clostridium felsineum DSM 794]
MENSLLKLAASQGIWASLSIALIFYIIKAQEKRDIRQELREKNYEKIIFTLTKEFKTLENIKKDINELKENIKKII